MDCRDRAGRRVEGGEGQDRFLRGLYGTRGGRVCVKLLIQPWVSKLGGRVLNSRLSRVGIPRFIEKNKIDMSQYEERSFRSYNDFFMRRIKPEMRPVSMEATRLISPCDSRLTVHEITESSCFAIKGTMYTMESLLRDKALARVYDGGTLLDLNRHELIYQFDFSVIRELTEDDTRQQDDLNSLDELRTLAIDVDYLDPGNGSDGDIEHHTEIPLPS